MLVTVHAKLIYCSEIKRSTVSIDATVKKLKEA